MDQYLFKINDSFKSSLYNMLICNINYILSFYRDTQCRQQAQHKGYKNKFFSKRVDTLDSKISKITLRFLEQLNLNLLKIISGRVINFL